MTPLLLTRIVAANERGESAALVTDLASGRQALIGPGGALDGLELDREDRRRIELLLSQGASTLLETATGRYFLETYHPPLRLVVIGAVHIAQTLAPMAASAGYHVTIVDPRSAFASPERFPGCTLSTEWPDEAIAALAPDARTAILALSHDPKLDDPALAAALASAAFYVGALGSRQTHARRLERLLAAGVEPASFGRLHGPVGLDIGALTPAEIAISILAQMTQCLRAERIRARESRPAP